MEAIDTSLVDWSRAQFALTAMYHWLFVPLTLGLGVVMAIMETLYVRTGREFWKQTAKFWMKLFGINFAMGVATGIILEFEFGTNWSNYSWFVGDIFGAPLAIEGILAFFMESTFIAVMYFGWNKVSKRAHLASTWLTIVGATISAWWILVANAWMQHPVGMEFNPDTVRNEMVDFVVVAFNGGAVVKFCHTVASAWVLGCVFVVGVSCWYLLRGRHKEFAHASIKVAAWFGLVAALLTAYTGHHSGRIIAEQQPMKLAATEGLYEGGHAQGLVLAGVLRPGVDWAAPTQEDKMLLHMEVPYALSVLATHEAEGYVPGIRNILEGGYTLPDGSKALSAEEKMLRGRMAIEALAAYRDAEDEEDKAAALKALRENFDYFGYGYLKEPADLVPSVPLTFYSFRIMVMLGGYFIVLFAGLLVLRHRVEKWRLVQWGVVLTIPLAWLASQAGWVVAEVGRQPWAIQGLLPNVTAISRLETGSVQTTFFIFLVLFTLLLVAELGIMGKAIATGPETDKSAA